VFHQHFRATAPKAYQRRRQTRVEIIGFVENHKESPQHSSQCSDGAAQPLWAHTMLARLFTRHQARPPQRPLAVKHYAPAPISWSRRFAEADVRTLTAPGFGVSAKFISSRSVLGRYVRFLLTTINPAMIAILAAVDTDSPSLAVFAKSHAGTRNSICISQLTDRQGAILSLHFRNDHGLEVSVPARRSLSEAEAYTRRTESSTGCARLRDW